MLDVVVIELSGRFDRTSKSLTAYIALEEVLTLKSDDMTAVDRYTELSADGLRIELALLHKQFPFRTLAGAKTVFQDMSPEVRRLFPEIEKLIR